VALSMAWPEAGVEADADKDRALGLLTAFRGELYRLLAAEPIETDVSAGIGLGEVVYDEPFQ
jgi:hypothetical protein